MKKLLLCSCMLVAVTVSARAQVAAPRVAPTADQILSLKRVGSPQISPDGRFVAYTVRETNWEDNAYETEIWLADTSKPAVRQLTKDRKSVV